MTLSDSAFLTCINRSRLRTARYHSTCLSLTSISQPLRRVYLPIGLQDSRQRQKYLRYQGGLLRGRHTHSHIRTHAHTHTKRDRERKREQERRQRWARGVESRKKGQCMARESTLPFGSRSRRAWFPDFPWITFQVHQSNTVERHCQLIIAWCGLRPKGLRLLWPGLVATCTFSRAPACTSQPLRCVCLPPAAAAAAAACPYLL